MNLKFWKKPKIKLPERNIEEIKGICKIIFIDDKAFPVIDILKNSGWICTRRLKDIDSLDQVEIKESHILFVDIQGVGRKLKFQDEGLGLIVALKHKYPSKKVVAYSAEDQGRVEAFHKGINLADSRLSKSADPYEFQFLVERLAKETFSLNECVERIKTEITRQFGVNYNSEEVIKSLNKVYIKNEYSVDYISKVFNLQNAASVASIIQLFLTGQSR